MNFPAALIFDLDGVITDTAGCHFTAWKQLSARLKLYFDEADNERLKGVSRRRSFEIILERNNRCGIFSEAEIERFIDEKNRFYVELIGRLTPADILPGIPALMNAANANGIPMAVASASRNACTVLERLGLANAFSYVANAAKIVHPKPHPEVFLNCAAHLDVPSERCVGFEDSQVGVEAIAAAGMFSVGIGVDVTSITPDLPLCSAGQLKFEEIISVWQHRGQGENGKH